MLRMLISASTVSGTQNPTEILFSYTKATQEPLPKPVWGEVLWIIKAGKLRQGPQCNLQDLEENGQSQSLQEPDLQFHLCGGAWPGWGWRMGRTSRSCEGQREVMGQRFVAKETLSSGWVLSSAKNCPLSSKGPKLLLIELFILLRGRNQCNETHVGI